MFAIVFPCAAHVKKRVKRSRLGFRSRSSDQRGHLFEATSSASSLFVRCRIPAELRGKRPEIMPDKSITFGGASLSMAIVGKAALE
jgi:hypothetical protein